MNKVLLQITLLGFAIASAAAGNLNQATITRVVKNVEVISQGAQPKPANVGETVGGGSDVRTGEESRAQLTFPDQTLARLGENTVFSFERGTRALDLESGAILLQVPKDAGGATIRSAPVTAAITGTTVMMEYSPGNPGTVKLIVLEGTVRLSLAGRLGESVLVGAGQMISVAANVRSLPNPSTVTNSRPCTSASGVRQLLKDRQAGLPSASASIIATEQAPQSPSAHPSLEPVRPDARSQSSSGVLGSTPVRRMVSPLSLNSRALFMVGNGKSAPLIGQSPAAYFEKLAPRPLSGILPNTLGW